MTEEERRKWQETVDLMVREWNEAELTVKQRRAKLRLVLGGKSHEPEKA